MNKENESVRSLAKRAAQAALELAHVSHAARNEALVHIRDQLLAEEKRIIAANQRDLQRAEKEALATPLLKRLRFQEREIANVCKGIEATSALPDPLGRVIDKMALDEGLILQRITVPIGTIGVVFESRPDALVQIAALSLKSGNCTLMKGGREAEETNMLLAEIISAACRDSEIPDGWLTLLTTRSEVRALLTCSDEVDLIIPRGSNAFVKSIMAESSIPVLGHADGVCHLYIDRHADSQMARAIAIDAKTQYPAVCNAAECLLIHADTAPTLLPHLVADLSARGVTLYGCPRTQEIASAVMEATPEHWGREYLALEMAVKVVASSAEAVQHINRYGSKHTDAIVTADARAAAYFMSAVDSASVLHNCSTRFSDGYRYGLGAEIGISTNKIHARGPVGLEGLVTYKWHLAGDGHVVADYTGEDARPFRHRPL